MDHSGSHQRHSLASSAPKCTSYLVSTQQIVQCIFTRQTVKQSKYGYTGKRLALDTPRVVLRTDFAKLRCRAVARKYSRTVVCHINVTPGSAAPSNAPQLQQMSPTVALVCLENNTSVTHLPCTFSDSLLLERY